VTMNDPGLSQLSDGVWTAIPPGGTGTSRPTVMVTGKIYDARIIPPKTRGQLAQIDLSIIPQENEHYWRIPTQIAPILTYLLFHVSNLPKSNCKEIELAKRFGALLTARISASDDSDSNSDIVSVRSNKRKRQDD